MGKVIVFLMLSILVIVSSMLIGIYLELGVDFIKIISFILQIIGVCVPLYTIYKDATKKLPEFENRKLIEDSKSSHFDLKRSSMDSSWSKANSEEKKILNLQYQLDDLSRDIKNVKSKVSMYDIWFNIVWDNFTYMNDYYPKDVAKEQLSIMFIGAGMTIVGAFLSFWNVELYNAILFILK